MLGVTLRVALVCAFVLLGFTTQTHIHFAAGGGSALQLSAHEPSHPAPHDHETLCPLCQAIGFAGSFIDSAPAKLSGPVKRDGELLVSRPLIPAAAARRSHDWQSRGPPAV